LQQGDLLLLRNYTWREIRENLMKKKKYSPFVPKQHSHDHPHEHEHGHSHKSGLWSTLASALHLPGSGHIHARPQQQDAMFSNRLGTRALVWSLGLLLATTIIQVVIYVGSGSVALLADTVHNLGDALNSVPLLIAFWLARKMATKRYTYGYARAEDLAGLLIVASIVFSAGYILWEVVQKLLNPVPIENSGWVALAAVVGFLGNEAVAVLEIRVGKQIGSEAMVVDGRHARIDGFTSLAVLPAVLGTAIGLPILDPIFGVLIGIAILFITREAAIAIWYRLMDAVEPAVVAQVGQIIQDRKEVVGVTKLRMRWVGHSLWVEGSLKVQPELNAAKIETVLSALTRELQKEIPNLGEVTLSIG
jgi:cation diffusion facilitator family transporter